MAELAEFVWQLVDIFDQGDSPVTDCADMNQFAAKHWPLLKIKLHENFFEICQTLAELDEGENNIPLVAASYLKSWLSAGLIESIYIKQQG